MLSPKFVYIGPIRIKLIEDFKLSHNKFIPKGFESDLGSIPSYFWWFLTPHDIKYSSIIHDYEWLLSDFERYNYSQSNINFYFNAINMDKIPKWKAFISFIVLEIVKLYKFNLYSRIKK